MHTDSTLRSLPENGLDVPAHLNRVLLVNVVILLLEHLGFVQKIVFLRVFLGYGHHRRRLRCLGPVVCIQRTPLTRGSQLILSDLGVALLLEGNGLLVAPLYQSGAAAIEN